MHPRYIAKYSRYLRLCQKLTRLFPPFLSLPLCGWLSRWSRVPRPGSDAWSRAALIFPHLSERSYKEHLVLLGVMEGVSFYFQKFERLLKGVKFDRALASMPEIDSGILVLTYHHHFNILLCAFLGRLLNRPLNILAMDPDLSPLAKPLAWYKDILYDKSEQLLSGGRYVLVRPGSGNSVTHGLRDLVRRNSALISVHDFGHPFENDRAMNFNVLGRQLAAPVGAIAFAVRRNIPIYAVWLDWEGGAGFIIKGKLLDAGSEEQVLQGYFSNLEAMISVNPALWEGWPSICDLELVPEVPTESETQQ